MPQQRSEAFIHELIMHAFPAILAHPRHAGPEDEYVIVKPDGTMGDVTPIFPMLVAMGWEPKYDPVTMALVGATQDGVEIGMEVGVGTMEIGFAHGENLLMHQAASSKILQLVDDLLHTLKLHRLKDYAVQPITPPCRDHWAPKGRAHFFRTHFPQAVHVQTTSASTQVHIDVTRDEIIPVMKVLLSLSPVLTALSANSPIWGGRMDPEGMIAARQHFWDRFTAGTVYRHNVHVGNPIYDEAFEEQTPTSLDELARWISHTSFLVHVKNGQLITPNIPFQAWYKKYCSQYSEAELREHYMSHEGTLWWEVRPRIRYGTIEVRPACQGQHAIAIQALILGLVENWKQALVYVRHASIDWRSMHVPCLRNGLMAPNIIDHAKHVIALSCAGLLQRGFGEETLLEPLHKRVASGRSPAHDKIDLFQTGGAETLLTHLFL